MTTPDPDRELVARASADVTYGAMRTIDRDNGGGGATAAADASPRSAARATPVIVTILFARVYSRRSTHAQRTHTTHTTRAKDHRRQHRRAVRRHSMPTTRSAARTTQTQTTRGAHKSTIIIDDDIIETHIDRRPSMRPGDATTTDKTYRDDARGDDVDRPSSRGARRTDGRVDGVSRWARRPTERYTLNPRQ